MKSRFLTSIVMYSIIVVVTNITIGTYFETYETIINSIVYSDFFAPVEASFFVSSWLGVLHIFSKLSHIFEFKHLYSIVFTVLNILVFSTISLNLDFLLPSKIRYFKRIFIQIILFFLLFDSLLNISNHRLAFYACFAACLSFISYKKHFNFMYLLLTIFLLLISIICRVEITIIALSCFLIFNIFFQRNIILYNIIALTFAIGIYTSYLYVQKNFFSEIYEILLSEKLFVDNYTTIYTNTISEADLIKMEAMLIFIKDNQHYTIKDYVGLNETAKKDLNYVNLSNNFKLKLEELIEYLNPHSKYIRSLILILLILIFYAFKKNYILYLKSILFSMTLILLLSVVNLFASIPPSIIFCIISGLLILLFFSTIQKNKSLSVILIITSTILITSTFFHGKNKLLIEQTNLEAAKKHRDLIENLSKKGKIIVFANGLDYINYPSRLFSCLANKKTIHYYLDFNFLNNFTFYKNHNKQFFGANIGNIKNRILKCTNNSEVAFISKKEFNELLHKYMYYFHDTCIRFELIDENYKSKDVEAYYIISENTNPDLNNPVEK